MTDTLNTSSPVSSTSPTPTEKDGAKVDVVVPAGSLQPAATPSAGPVPVSSAPIATPPTKPPSKKMSPKMLFAAIGLFILVLGAGVGFYLLGQSQDLRQQAAGGYLSCAGGVESGKKACSGFRAYVTCNNGAFSAPTTCSANQICQSGNCVAEAAQSCAGGVPNGARSCDTFRSYVTCNNGSFGASTPCNGNQTCSNGSCGGGGGGCPAGSNPITGGVDVGACRCTATGQVVEIGGSCNPVPSVVPGATPTASPGTGGVGACVGTVCTPPTGGCIAIHTCNQFDAQGHCTVSNPQVTTSVQNAQQIANSTCKCVQVDVLNGQNGSCVNGHINGDPSTLIGHSNVCPNNGCTNPVPSPVIGGPSPSPQSSPQASPRVTPTPGATPSPVASPTPGVTPSPSPSPGVTPSPAPICVNISISKSNVVVGDNVTFTCGTVAGATSYEFRVKSPDGTTSPVTPMTTGSTQSQSFTIAQQGDYKAQCRICVGNACQEWEAL